MTQISTLDVSAIAARREAAAPAARAKHQADFGQAFQRAEHPHEARPHRDDARVDAKQPHPHADKAEKADKPEKPAEPQQQAEAPKAETAPAADQPKAEAAKQGDDAPKAQDANQAQPDTQAQAQAADQAQQPADPQAALALMLATSGQVGIAQQTQVATQAAATQATEVAAVTAQSQAQTAQDAATAQAAGQTQVDAKAQAQAQAQPQQQALAQAEAQPQVPDLLAQAAGALGPIKVTVGKAEQANLTVKLIDDQQQANQAEGPTAPATKLDGAVGIETASLPVDLLPKDDADTTDPNAKDDASLAAPAQQINPEPKAEQAKAADKSEAAAAPHEVLKQILDRAEQIKGAQQNSVKLQLYPEHLGKMEIRVSSHQGVISAQLMADTPQAKALLDGQLASLQRSFAEMGLKVDKVEVTLSSANLGQDAGNPAFTGFDQQQQQQQREPQHQAMRQGAGLGYEQWLPETEPDG
ncbi:MAG: fliK, partial [Cyanobacteria bacterium RYN_339]|nr:fliK [Cyanobacteria bacterium RYN_339]